MRTFISAILIMVVLSATADTDRTVELCKEIQLMSNNAPSACEPTQADTVIRTRYVELASMLAQSEEKKGTSNRAVNVQIMNLMGNWESVLTVHGFYDNKEAALDVVRGLGLVSQQDGTVARNYKVER